MNSSVIKKKLLDKYFPYIIIIIFFTLSLILILRHEFWEDEVLVWEKIAYNSSFSDYILKMKDSSGSPHLWYLIVYFIKQFITDNIESMKIIHLAISTTTVFLILKYSPFNKIIRTLIVFSYLFFYEYSIIARNYAPGILLMIIFCILYEDRIKNIIPISVVLFLMGQANIFSFILSFILFIYFLWDIFTSRNKIKAKYIFFISLSMLLFEIVVVFIQLGSQIFGDREYGTAMSEVFNWGLADYKNAIVITSRGILSAFFQLPQNILNFWNTNIFINFLSGFRNVYTVLLSSVLFFITLLLIKRKYIFIYLFGSIGIASIPIFIYPGNSRHWGHLFILLIVCVWLSGFEKEGVYFLKIVEVKIEKIRNIFLMIILSLSIIGSSIAFYYDYRYPFSSGKNIAEYIEANFNKKDLKIIGYRAAEVSLISTYLDEPFYYPGSKKIQDYIYTEDRLKWIDIETVFKEAYSFVMKDNDVLAIISKNIYVPEGLPEYYTFIKIDHDLPPAIVYKEDYSLYIFSEKTFYKSLVFSMSADHNNFLEYWRSMNQCKFAIKNSKVRILINGDDPWFESKFPIEFKDNQPLLLKITIDSPVEGEIRIFYGKNEKEYVWEDSRGYPLIEGTNNIGIRIPYSEDLQKIRIDPIDKNQDCVIEKIDLYYIEEWININY